MNQRDGRRFMWRLLSLSQVLHVPGPCGEAEANFANGRRAIGTTLWGEITACCPEQFVLMQQEADQDAQTSAERRKQEAEHDGRGDDGDSSD